LTLVFFNFEYAEEQTSAYFLPHIKFNGFNIRVYSSFLLVGMPKARNHLTLGLKINDFFKKLLLSPNYYFDNMW